MTWGHAYPEYAVKMARAAGVKRVALFHHAPDASDAALDMLAAKWAPPCGAGGLPGPGGIGRGPLGVASYIDLSVLNSVLSGLLIAIGMIWARYAFNRLWQQSLAEGRCWCARRSAGAGLVRQTTVLSAPAGRGGPGGRPAGARGVAGRGARRPLGHHARRHVGARALHRLLQRPCRSMLSLLDRDLSPVLPCLFVVGTHRPFSLPPDGGLVLIADSPIGRLRGAISHAPRTPPGPGGRPRRSTRRVKRRTPPGSMRLASVCGVSPSGPPGSLCFATSISRGKAASGFRCQIPASRLRFGWLERP